MQVDKINNRTYQPDDDSLVVRQARKLIHRNLTFTMSNRFSKSALILMQGMSEHKDTYRSLNKRIGSFGLGNTAEALSHVIHDISREMLASYSWEVKVVVILAAFAVNYGDVWLAAQICSTNPPARSIAILKQVPELIEHFKSLQPHFDAIDISISTLIVEFSELPLEYLSLDTPPISVAKVHIPAASYWTLRAIVACTNHVANVTGMRYEYSATTSELWELSDLTHKLIDIHGHLESELDRCRQHISEMKDDEEYRNLIRIFESSHLDNSKVIRALLSPKNESKVLVIGNDMEKRPVSIDVLRRKHVLLIISDLNLPSKEIEVVVNVYGMRHDIQCEMVWIPVVGKLNGWQEQNQYKFAELQAVMPWYTVTTPLVIEPTVISDEKEQAIWRAERWRLELLVDGIEEDILEWGFTTKAKNVAKALNITIELIYAGKNNTSKKGLERIYEVIEEEKLSLFWPDYTSTWFFWTRLESMRISKTRHGKTVENDQIMKEIQTILGYDGSDQGWMMLCRGAAEMARATGKLAVSTLNEFNSWQSKALELGLVPAIVDELKRRRTREHCNHLVMPGNLDVSGTVICADCSREMEKYFFYRNDT
ncbi:hypothetical protein FEM48_ZijujUnG0106800 [Ziziphus jujuba var. spinosa]|uniref:Protein SIEVE ELEMENT OCCLUSION B-like n=1 Tax=Ziziphus jujuba var. spinosa TaxID=714518 RepID=A0A978U848_ZIZJJ|nr:hypothetical protein FEM48_ZijujUnG0106800 [Ziziphus jujuba var. spinosa]